MTITIKNGLLRMQDLLRAAPVTRRAVRFYEERGLLTSVSRDRQGRRLYGYGDVLRLRLIHDLRRAGLSLAAILQLLEIGVAAQGGWIDRLAALLSAHGDRLREQMQAIRTAEHSLRAAVEWLAQHRQALDQSREEEMSRLIGDPQVPLLVRAILCLSPSVRPPEQAPVLVSA